MFKANKESTNKDIETMIGPTVQVEGNFNSKGNIVIDGSLKGSLKTDKNIKIGEGAKINANISADNAMVSGEVRGNIKIKGVLEVKATARIMGDIETNQLSVEIGALINGKCTMVKEEPEPIKIGEFDNKKK